MELKLGLPKQRSADSTKSLHTSQYSKSEAGGGVVFLYADQIIRKTMKTQVFLFLGLA